MIFDGLTEGELELVETMGRPLPFTAGQDLVTEGEEGTSFFFLLSGRVEVRKRIEGESFKALAELGPCDLFGELGFLGLKTRSASVVSLTDGVVLVFRKEDFEAFLSQHPETGLKAYRGMAMELAHRLAKSDEQYADAVIWALGQSGNRVCEPEQNLPFRPRLRLART